MKTFQILSEAYGDETLSCAHVLEWHNRFSGKTISEDEPAGCSREKKPELGSGGCLWQQDNTPVHTALSVKQFLTSKIINVMGHPPYSSDLAPCYFFPLQLNLTSRKLLLPQLKSYTRAFGDGPRNFEPWSSDVDAPELAPPLLTTTPHQREDVSALDRFNVHRCPTRRVFSGTGLEFMTYLPWPDTLTTGLPQPT
ncbi:hypothetical protein TNCV_307991 [Trichonephila clavipes]|nr:hypothetical protein TNCV_307991 [Trichonephila clavipes]